MSETVCGPQVEAQQTETDYLLVPRRNIGGIPETMVCRILRFMWVFWPLMVQATLRGPVGSDLRFRNWQLGRPHEESLIDGSPHGFPKYQGNEGTSLQKSSF